MTTTHQHKSCPLNLGVACCICQPHGCPVTTPQQTEEEPIGANLDQIGEEFIERISKLPAQQQPEEEHEKFEWKNCERCGLQYGLHGPSDGHLFVGAPYANTTPQQQPEEKCKNYLPICFNCGRSQSAHPQQTEQWMEGKS